MTAFYSPHLLQGETGEKDRYGRPVGFFRVPDMKPYIEKIKKNTPWWYDAYFSDKKGSSKIIKFGYEFTQTTMQNLVHIQFVGYADSGAIVQLARVTLSTVDSNCGSVIISNLYSEVGRCGLGTFLFTEVMRYIQVAGYSFVLLNTAGQVQNQLGVSFFQEKFGFTPFKNQIYVNTRSGNANVWYFKFIEGVQRIPYKELSSYRQPDDDDEDYNDEEDYEREDD
jgi:hypothetical protein